MFLAIFIKDNLTPSRIIFSEELLILKNKESQSQQVAGYDSQFEQSNIQSIRIVKIYNFCQHFMFYREFG